MIYITGDTHGPIDIHKINSVGFPQGKELSKQDYLIVTGDFGLIFDVNKSSKEEKYWLDWLTNKPWTTLFCDGNHENFDRLNQFPIIEKFGGKVGNITNSIFHLKRGEIYTIDDETFFVFGGAISIDKEHRRYRISWWPEEVPTHEEFNYGIDKIATHNNKVDYVIAHTAPKTIIKKMIKQLEMPIWEDKIDITEQYFDEIIKHLKFNKWYFGHYHADVDIDNKFRCLYEDIILLGK